jgi:hypothetical protein
VTTRPLNPQLALRLLDDTVSRIQLVINREGLSVGLTRNEHLQLLKAVEGLQHALTVGQQAQAALSEQAQAKKDIPPIG